MMHAIFSTVWYVFALVVFVHNEKHGKPVDVWFHTAIICGTVWAATA